MQKLLALVDCNNFYASCERVFNPRLQGKPVIVLSNNDGCVIARSNEAKELGVGMGVPVFKIEKLISDQHIAVYSSNYSLYGDMSQRVMEVLSQHTPEIEIYSIDEAFLDLSGFESRGLDSYAHQIRNTVKQWTGIPVSIGIAPTKTLAKVANYFAKRDPDKKGVCNLSHPSDWKEALAHIPIDKIWGIGPSYQYLMGLYGIKTGLDISHASPGWIRKHMGIVGVRMLEELQGNPCLDLDLSPAPKKGICSSRAFGKRVEDLRELEEAVATYIARAAEKLRKEHLATGVLTVFITTDPFRDNFYSNSSTVTLPVATNFTPELAHYALRELREIYREGFLYKKAGVYLQDLVSENRVQQNLFDSMDRTGGARLMKTMDRLNFLMGEGTIKLAAQGLSPQWKTKFLQRSPRYTTHWDEILRVRG